MYSLDYHVVQGTIIMSSGDWALLKLNPYTIQTMGLYAKCRLWVPLNNLMYGCGNPDKISLQIPPISPLTNLPEQCIIASVPCGNGGIGRRA